MTQQLHQGTAFITGGARRIGRALALALAGKGYHIALHCNHSVEEAENVAAEIRAKGKRCAVYPCDLLASSGLEPLMQQVFNDFPDCNILVNNASIFERFSFQATDEDVFDRHFAINFKSPFFLTQYFAARCKKGVVLNMLDSYISKQKSPYFVYMLSKKSLYELTKMTAVALGPTIRVNGVSPGLTELSTDEDAALLEKKKQVLPLRRIAKVDEIVAAAIQLIESDYLTGQVLNVDGGEHLL